MSESLFSLVTLLKSAYLSQNCAYFISSVQPRFHCGCVLFNVCVICHLGSKHKMHSMRSISLIIHKADIVKLIINSMCVDTKLHVLLLLLNDGSCI